jgi:hypothetical protein
MEELFKQSFSYARIHLFRNYSNIGIRNIIEKVVPDRTVVSSAVTEDNIFSECPLTIKRFVVSAVKKESVNDLVLYLKDSKHFFHTTTPTDSFVRNDKKGMPTIMCDEIKLVNVKPIIDNSGSNVAFFETTEDRHIKQHFNNPFAKIEINKIERWIKRDDNKITLKFYVGSRNRNVNSIYFSKATSSTTITFNLKTGNFTIVVYTSGRGKKKKHFYCNSFNALKTSLPVFYNIRESHIDKRSILYKQYVEIFDTIQFQFAVKLALGFDDISFGSSSEILSSDFIYRWMRRFIEIKKIKLPNDGADRLLRYYYPTEKFLKKNNRKLVAAVLDRFKAKSNITIKILHQYPAASIQSIVLLCRLFGNEFPKYIGNINEYFFCGNDEQNDAPSKSILLDNREHFQDLQDSEKENIVHILNDLCSVSPIVPHALTVISTITDHFNMIYRIRDFYPDMKLTPRKWETFQAEHLHIARIEREIQRGYSIEYLYDPYVLREIETPIETTELNEQPIMYLPNIKDRIEYDKMYANYPTSASIVKRVFEPKLLRTSDDYFEEGLYMNHCVSGYLNSEWSIIVSLRLGKERVTCEFDVKTRICHQSKYFSNQKPPVYFEKALKILSDRIKSISYPISSIDKKRVDLIINGVEVKPDPQVVHPFLQEMLP